MTDFVHLHVHSEYSLLDGACRIKELVARVKELGQTACAVTDHGNMFAAIEFYNACKAGGIKPIIGCEVYVAPTNRFERIPGEAGKPFHLILLCENNEGYKNLIKLVSLGYTEGFYNRPRVDKQLLRRYSKGLICLSACLAGEIPRKLLEGDYEGAKNAAREYREFFGRDNFFLELQDHKTEEDRRCALQLIKLSRDTGIPLVVTNDCHYLRREDADAQGILMCISTNTTLDDPYRMQFPTEEFYVKSGDEMAELFPSLPEAAANTCRIAERCNVTIEFRNTKLPAFTLDGVTDNAAFLRDMCYKGLYRLYGTPSKEAVERLEYELRVIIEMGYTNYYLIVWDFINYAREHDIPVGPGRGSGAGSLYAYCIGITGIDPLKYDLLFERFLNPERKTMPDFDIDFCMEGRQQVIDHVIRKYGADHVAQIVTFGTLGAKQAVRDCARAMGLSYKTGDTVAKLVHRKLPLAESAETIPELKRLMSSDPDIHALIDNAIKIEGMPRNCSTHAAGVLIAPAPVDEFVPLYARDGTVSTQYTMTVLESLGLLKFDFLGLRNLTIIKHCCEYIRRTNPDFDPEKIPLDDPEVYRMFSEGRTEGVFQFESDGMTSVVSRLRPEGIEDLIAVISLYRPGPMDSIPTYIRNRHDPSRITYKHPLLKGILEVTYGCIVYQEQVMQIFRTLAGYSYGRADMVRKAMSKKKHEELERERKSFIYGDETCCGAMANGLSEKLANEIFNEMTSFASYAFNKSHAAAYATLAYRTAYLKCHFYQEYMAALMTNALIESIEKLHSYIIDLGRNGVALLPIDINRSFRGFVPESEGGRKGIRFALGAVKSLGDNAIAAIVSERERGGEFTSLQDFCARVSGRDINSRVVEALIKAGAMDCFPNNRHEMLASCEKVMKMAAQDSAQRMEGQLDMFGGIAGGDRLDIVIEKLNELPPVTLLEMEHEALGMYISAHPIDEYRPYIYAYRCITSAAIAEMTEENDGKRVNFFGILAEKRMLKTRKGDMMCFIKLEDKLSTVEAVVFPSVFAAVGGFLEPGRMLFIKGRISAREDEAPKILADIIDTPEGMMRVSSNAPIFVRMSSGDSEGLSRLSSAVRELSDPAGGELRIFLADKGKSVSVRDARTVRIDKAALTRLQQVAGEDNVAFMERK